MISRVCNVGSDLDYCFLRIALSWNTLRAALESYQVTKAIARTTDQQDQRYISPAARMHYALQFLVNGSIS